jgi:hypothetical protein
VLDGLMHDSVQLVVRHHLEEMARQFFARQEVLIMCSRWRGSCPPLP